jgi:hypothetical protein
VIYFCRILTKVQIYRHILVVQNIKIHGTVIDEAGSALRCGERDMTKPTVAFCHPSATANQEFDVQVKKNSYNKTN